MEHIWAPWRMAYINREGPKDEGCFLCTAPQRQDDEHTYILARGERCFVILNQFPYNPGHLMIAPYEHVPTIEELKPPALTEMMVLAQRSLAALRTAMTPDGYNMGINQGRVAGAGVVDHVHYHVVPRWNGDTNFMPVLADVKIMPELLDSTYRKVREALLPLMPARRTRPSRSSRTSADG
jgi:ATP adenylyltransferase